MFSLFIIDSNSLFSSTNVHGTTPPNFADERSLLFRRPGEAFDWRHRYHKSSVVLACQSSVIGHSWLLRCVTNLIQPASTCPCCTFYKLCFVVISRRVCFPCLFPNLYLSVQCLRGYSSPFGQFNRFSYKCVSLQFYSVVLINPSLFKFQWVNTY